MSRRTPPINTRGLYELKEPFELDSSTIYICHAIRTFRDIRERGFDPYKLYYEPHDLSRDDYEEDREDDATIVTLISESGDDVIYVPDTYILAFPDMGEIKYQRVVVSIDFGALPEYVEFDHVREQLASIGEEVIGVEPETRIHIAPSRGSVSPDEHQDLESARQENIRRNDTFYSLYREKDNALERAHQKIETLEKILIDQGIIGNGD